MMESKLQEAIQFSLKYYLWHNAVFLAEQLYAQSATDSNLLTLATCYYKSGKANRSYEVLKSCTSIDGKYLFAVCCFEMGKLKEAEMALTTSADHKQHTQHPASLFLLGLIYRKLNQRERAIECLRESLQLYPFLWTAFENLCALGDDVDPNVVFNSNIFTSPTMQSKPSTNNLNISFPNASTNSPISPRTPFSSYIPPSPIPTTLTSPAMEFTTPLLTFITPPASINHATPKSVAPGWCLNMTKSGGSNGEGVPISITSSPPSSSFSTLTPLTPVRKPTVPPNKRKPDEAGRKSRFAIDSPTIPRRNVRLSVESVDLNNSFYSVNSTIRSGSDDKLSHKREKVKDKRTFRSHAPSISLTGSQLDGESIKTNQSQKQSVDEVLLLLRTFGTIYKYVSTYKCKEALGALGQLPHAVSRTGWALVMSGRAHFELVDFRTAASCFEEARRLEPHRLEGMEIYSTVLWHLRREIDLSYLAHSLIDFDRLDPRSWCAVGNCYSLQKDHDTALKMFRRAIQLDNSFTYAHTLSGHEYVANDDLDKALASFRSAIRIDPRHYNAWYGLGIIYFRQESHKLAEYHFRRALSINGISSVLYCYVGMVLNANKQYEEALEMFECAISLNRKNSLARYKKACALAALRNIQDAINVLESLCDTAPRDSSIYISLARLYRQNNEPYKAISALATATDLDPKNSVELKSSMDKLVVGNADVIGELEDDIIL